jgi:hypothetical protein
MSCIDATQLKKMIDIPKFNQMISNTTTVANDFLNNYIQEQNDIKNGVEERNAKLNEARYNKTAADKKRLMTEKHNSIMDILNRDYTFLQQQSHSMQNTTDLFNMLTKQNSKLEKKMENQLHTIELSDRKTYYEDERNVYLEWWSNIFSSVYRLLIVIFICGIIFTRNYYKKHLWFIVGFLIVYPTIGNFLFYLLSSVYYWLINNLQSVYITANI